MRYFHFVAPDTEFHGELDTRRCTHRKANGEQCKNRVQIGLPTCWLHRKFNQHLVVQPSTIPGAGDGVFAVDTSKGDNEIVFKPHDRVCYYNGEVISEAELNARYGDSTAPYGIKRKHREYEDGAIQRGIGTLFNHKPRSQANCELKTNNQGKVVIMARKNIRNGHEMFVSYGDRYRMAEEGVASSTNRRKRTV